MSLAERITSWKVTIRAVKKKWKVLRGSAWEESCILNSIPLCLLWTPHCYIPATNPVALPHSRGMWKPQPFCCQAQTRLIKAWDCQYPGSIVWISQLAQCQHDVPLKALVSKVISLGSQTLISLFTVRDRDQFPLLRFLTALPHRITTASEKVTMMDIRDCFI